MVKFKSENLEKNIRLKKNLHSNMVKFKCCKSTDKTHIKLNLHSNMVKFKLGGLGSRANTGLIYIPIWLNSNYNLLFYYALQYIFTFQYG